MLRWSPPPPIHVNGIIDHYVIRVRGVYTGRVFSLLTEDTSILLGPLHPYYIYLCQIAAYTVSLGPFSPPISVQAGETREFDAPCIQYYGSYTFSCVCLSVAYTGPTAAPQNVTYGDRTNVSIMLIWHPPPFSHQNGLIRRYSIIVTHSISGSQLQLTTTSNSTMFTVGGLQPHTSYLFSIAAETVSLGPYSDNINISTVEGGRPPCIL